MNIQKSFLNRRRFLQIVGGGAAALASRDFLPPLARATSLAPDEVPYLIVCSFGGGWDQLLTLDPRDNTQYTEGAIIPAYHLCTNGDVKEDESGLITPLGSNITFGPAVGTLANHFDKLCVIRGINMGTLTHTVARRYFVTGKFPRGLAANGSALGTWMVDATGNLDFPIPNLCVGVESFNEGLATFASALQVEQSQDILSVLIALGQKDLPNLETQDAIDAYLAKTSCGDQLYDGERMVTTFKENRQGAKLLASGDLYSLFAFNKNATGPDILALYEAFGIDTSNQMIFNQQKDGAKGQAMIAAQAIVNDISQVVCINLANGIDHHDEDYQTNHYPALTEGCEALSSLIGYLESKGVWERTTLLVTSEFARTPTMNARGGRDHHLSSSCILAGKGIRANTVIGATDDETYVFQPVDLATGKVNAETGAVIRPPDIHATLLKAMGLDYSHLSNQSPQIIEWALSEA